METAEIRERLEAAAAALTANRAGSTMSEIRAFENLFEALGGLVQLVDGGEALQFSPGDSGVTTTESLTSTGGGPVPSSDGGASEDVGSGADSEDSE